MSWPQSSPPCIVLVTGSFITWTIGWSLDPPSWRSLGRGTSFFDSVPTSAFRSTSPRALSSLPSAWIISFEGFSDSGLDSKGALSRRRILLLSRATSQSLALPPRGDVIPVHPHSRLQAQDEVAPTPPIGLPSSRFPDGFSLLGRLLPEGSSVVVRSVPSWSRCRPLPSSPGSCTLHRRVRLRLGRLARLRSSVRLVVSRCFVIFHQPPRAPGGLPSHSGFPSPSAGTDGVSLHRQHGGPVLPPQGRGHSLFHPQRGGADGSPPLRGVRCSSAPPVCPWSPQRVGRLSQSKWVGARLRVDPPSGSVSRPFPPLAGDGGFVHHLPQPPPASLFFADGGSADGGGGCSGSVLGQSAGICLPTFQPAPTSPQQSSLLPQPGAHSSSSVLAPPALVCRSTRSAGGGASYSSSPSGPAPSTPLPPVSREPPHAGADWISHCQRSARHFGFSAGVARQLAFSRGPSTRLNYQSKLSTCRAWCHSHGRSVSRPTVPKIANFLLYLRCSLHLSYCTMASYRSMLSAAFRFLLPELSSHPVLHDLLRSFRVERPQSSSRFPPWDHLRVLSLLRGSPFEPLESCSLRNLTRKTLPPLLGHGS